MAEAGTTKADEAARLEAALDRIARLQAAHPAAETASAKDSAALARRLDTLIADLRAVLGRDSGD
jgi:hypothetical protein